MNTYDTNDNEKKNRKVISVDDIDEEMIKAMWRKYNREKQRKRLADPDKRRRHNEYQQKWRHEHPEKKKIYNQRYRMRKALEAMAEAEAGEDKIVVSPFGQDSDPLLSSNDYTGNITGKRSDDNE